MKILGRDPNTAPCRIAAIRDELLIGFHLSWQLRLDFQDSWPSSRIIFKFPKGLCQDSSTETQRDPFRLFHFRSWPVPIASRHLHNRDNTTTTKQKTIGCSPSIPTSSSGRISRIKIRFRITARRVPFQDSFRCSVPAERKKERKINSDGG